MCLAIAWLATASACRAAEPVAGIEPCGADLDRQAQPGAAYVCDVVRAIEAQALAIGMVDWPQIKRDLVAQTRDVRSESDAHAAIAATLQRLDRHSRFLPSARVTELRSPQKRSDRVQTNADTGVAYIEVRGFRGIEPDSMLAYVRALRDGIAEAEAGRTCGYIVDLRRNPGGNMWPQLLGLQPLLGTRVVGGFRMRDGTQAWWRLEHDRASAAEVVAIAVGKPLARGDAAAARPVAVLVGTDTASAGEAVAIAFRERPATRFFGWHTAGLTTANATVTLTDQAALVLAVADMIDRKGNAYTLHVAPDEETVAALRVHRLHRYDDVTRMAAAEWLRTTPACAGVH